MGSLRWFEASGTHLHTCSDGSLLYTRKQTNKPKKEPVLTSPKARGSGFVFNRCALFKQGSWKMRKIVPEMPLDVCVCLFFNAVVWTCLFKCWFISCVKNKLCIQGLFFPFLSQHPPGGAFNDGKLISFRRRPITPLELGLGHVTSWSSADSWHFA